MKLKKGVIMAGLQMEMRPVLITADSVWRHFGQELVVTAGLDGEHSAGSLHYYGYALDFRTKYFTEEVKVQAFRQLRATVSGDYDVVLHSTHIHVEYDPAERRDQYAWMAEIERMVSELCAGGRVRSDSD